MWLHWTWSICTLADIYLRQNRVILSSPMLDSDQIQPFEPEVQESGPKRHTEANTALFLGIASVVLAAGALGLACAVFSFIAASRTLKDYKEHPEDYTPDSYSKAKAGIICSIISIVLLFVFAFFLISYFKL